LYSPPLLSLLSPPPAPPLFPYTTLFRSCSCVGAFDTCPYRYELGRTSRSLAASTRSRSICDAGRSARNRVTTAVGPGPQSASSTDRKSTRLNSSHVAISYAVFCLKKKNQ